MRSSGGRQGYARRSPGGRQGVVRGCQGVARGSPGGRHPCVTPKIYHRRPKSGLPESIFKLPIESFNFASIFDRIVMDCSWIWAPKTHQFR